MPLFTTTPLLLLLSLITSAYIPYSIYYQWRVAHKWCVLCLMTQAVLLINVLISIIELVRGHLTWMVFWQLHTLETAIFVGLTLTALFTTTKIILKKYKLQQTGAKYFAALKHDYGIKQQLFQRQKEVITDTIEKIVIHPEDSDTLTVIFNPVCTPCIRKMRKLLAIYQRKKETGLELIFLLEKNNPASRNMARYLLQKYAEDKENFIGFCADYVNRFPASVLSLNQKADDEPDMLDKILQIQAEWCARNHITSTPQLFLNGKECPSLYDIDDIDYMIN